jgi:hypothetical protein
MKALSLTQPWATLVATGAKLIETRGWYSRHRGPLAIHASKSFPAEARALCLREPFFSALARAGFHADTLPLGAVVAIANLSDVVPITEHNSPPEPERSFGNYSVPGRFAFVLETITPLPTPIPARGALSLWEWDEEGLVMSVDELPEDETPNEEPSSNEAPSVGSRWSVKGTVTWAGLPEPIEVEHTVEVEDASTPISAEEALRIIEEGIRHQYELANDEGLEWAEGPLVEFSEVEPDPVPSVVREWHIKGTAVLPGEDATQLQIEATYTAESDEAALFMAICDALTVDTYDLNTLTWLDLTIVPGAEHVEPEPEPEEPPPPPLSLLLPSELAVIKRSYERDCAALAHEEEALNKLLDKVEDTRRRIAFLKRETLALQRLIPPEPTQLHLL